MVLKPWLTNSEDLLKELRKLGLSEADLKLDRMPIILDTEHNPVDKVRNNTKLLKTIFVCLPKI